MEPAPSKSSIQDKWIQKFLSHLATDRGASAYTQRNYKQALREFEGWYSQGPESGVRIPQLMTLAGGPGG